MFKDELNVKYSENLSLKELTTFKAGGEADFVLFPETIEEIISCLDLIKKYNMPYYILGKGSNVLFTDKGFKGAIIRLGNNFSDMVVNGNTVRAQSGATLTALFKLAYENSLTGLEFASGIPGSVGGGVCMNAGAYGGELKDVIKSVTVLKDNKIVKLSNEECDFSYRNSRIAKEGLIVLEAEFTLEKGDKNSIKSLSDDFNKRRAEKQPINKPSAGSTFKRPEGYFAGKLIEDAGLRGYRIGGACVSEKHCGFVVNDNNGTSEDILNLIAYVQKTVNEKFGVSLETEVKIIK